MSPGRILPGLIIDVMIIAFGRQQIGKERHADQDQDEEGGGIGTSKMPATLDSDALETYSIEALQRRLQEVLDSEDYEMAARIRDELKRREAKD